MSYLEFPDGSLFWQQATEVNMELTQEQATEVIKLIEQAFLDGFDDEILVELHEQLTGFVSKALGEER